MPLIIKKGRLAILPAAAAFFLFISGSMLSPAHAGNPEPESGFSSTLETPPAFTPPVGTTDERPDCTVPANIRAHPGTCPVDARRVDTRSASIKSGYLDSPPDSTDTLRFGHIDRKTDEAPAGSQKNEYDWGVEIELRDSAVVEETGNAKRNDSIGGLIKGNIRF